MLLNYDEYRILFYFFLSSFVLVLILLFVSFILSTTKPDIEKISPYECGFEPFNDARITFDVHFYIVAILFMIFDLEIAYLFPWALYLGNLGFAGFYNMLFFLFVLTLGFVYEWQRGALDWSKPKNYKY